MLHLPLKTCKGRDYVLGAIGSRIAFARIRGRPVSLFVIFVYVPHKGRTNPAQVDTYEALD